MRCEESLSLVPAAHICLAGVHEDLNPLSLAPGLGYREAMRPLLVLLLIAIAFPVTAAETAWQELAPDVRARLISDDVRAADGTTRIALELDMPQTHNTYWVVPGETGIPTQLDLEGSDGIAGHRILWPYPTIEHAKGYVDFVYRGPTVLPVELAVTSDNPTVRVAVVMGICSDICVPAMTAFELPLDFARPDRGEGLRIAQAVALTPLPWDGAEPPLAFHYDAAAEALAVTLASPGIDPLSILADAGDAGLLFGAPQKSPERDLVLLPLLGGASGQGMDSGIDGMPVRFTFMTEAGPFTVTASVAPPGSTPDGL